jgi:flagellar M-ring protein FliF
MNESVQRFLKQVTDFFQGLSTTKKLLMAVVAALIATGAIIGVVAMKNDPYQLLYSDLQPEEAKNVIKKLGEQNIPSQISDDQTSVSVPASKVAGARMELAKAGVPGQDVVGFEKFDGTTLGMSSYVQRIQYIRAVQGELTRSIQRLASVKRARVHISVPPKKTFLEEEDPPKASVVLELRSGQLPSKTETNGIAHLVASAVEGLKVSQVTIVDTHGNFLHHPDEDNGQQVSSTLLEMQRSIETDYQKRIEDLLVPVVGLGKVRAKVTAEMDASRVNTTEETYDPDKAVVRNSLKNDEVSQGSRPNPIGIPGSRSNLPGTENQNPPVPMSNSTTEKNVQQSNYAIPKKVQTTDKPSGNIKRLTVAVLVDGNYTKVPGKTEEVFAPRSEEELRRLQDIVANAVGYDTQRRDSITVSSLPFKGAEIFPADEIPSNQLNWPELYRQGLKNGLLALVVLLFFFLVLRPFLRWATLSDLEKEITLLPKTVAELEAARQDQGVLALTQAASVLDESEPMEKKEEEELKKRIEDRFESAPKKGIRIIQDWLEEDALVAMPQAA